MKVSIVIPICNEEDSIEPILNRIFVSVRESDLREVIFIDDGSQDRSLDKIISLSLSDQRIKYLSFSRNFGHQAALRAGISYASGDCIVMLDGDLQQPPELIPQMIEKWEQGYQIVTTVRIDNASVPKLKKWTSRLFYLVMSRLSDTNIVPGSADFRLIDRRIGDLVKSSEEYELFFRGYFNWVGFKRCCLQYESSERCFGATKYSYRKMIAFATTGITSFSVKPLHLSALLGAVIAGSSALYGLYAIIMALFVGRVVPGWASVLVSVLFIGGMQMIVLGILGEYIARMFLQVKSRPAYIVQTTNLINSAYDTAAERNHQSA
ncbi:MAG: glycosyltransferase family 2 protein [Bacteroidia bacterium]|nr:glycosyltransferase family 2 protein [Bacteroidia bacterium]